MIPTWIVSVIVIAVAALSVVAVMYFVIKEGDHHEDYFNPDTATSDQQNNTPSTTS